MHARDRGGIRGVRASASLKRQAMRRSASLRQPGIRGVRASASLKRGRVRIGRRRRRGIRGVRASASLKLAQVAAVVAPRDRYPRRARLGLIEATPAAVCRADAGSIRGVRASASLKRPERSRQRHPARSIRGVRASASLKREIRAPIADCLTSRVSEACAPRPH